MGQETSKDEIQALISHLELLVHDLGQPLLVIRFAVELLEARSETVSKEELSAKIALISKAINESSTISGALSDDLQKLKKFL